MQPLKRRLVLLIAGIVGLGTALFALSFIAVNYLVDIWWFQSLGYEFYYWQRLLYRYAIFASVTLLFFLIFWLNFWVASRFLGASPPITTLKPTSLKAYKDLLALFRTGSMWVYTPLSLLLAIPIALPLFHQWESFLLFLFAPQTGMQDASYGNDISYYLFTFPIHSLLQRRLLIAFALLAFGLLLLYWLERRLLSRQDERLPTGAKIHLNIVILLIFFLEFWDFILQRYELLYNTSHNPLFFGPGYTEMHVTLPLIWISLVFLIGTAFSLMFFIHTRKGLPIFLALAALFALSLGARYSDFLPNLMQQYMVKPNAISKERPYIENSVRAALSAYNLNDVQVRDFDPERIPADITTPQILDILRNIPVWDGELLNDVYEQMQELRTYYDFSHVDVSHYSVKGNNQQVFLAARELNPAELPSGARNWVNEHLSYTHGYGLVMTPAAQGGDEPMTWFIKGIPLESEFGFNVEQPAIYYGQLTHYQYVIAPNDAGEFGYPQGSSNVMVNYQGEGGVPISSMMRKALFAYYFKDWNILFTTKTNENSKLLFRRNIHERIRTITPFFMLDGDPYLAATSKRLYWIQDAYTVSDKYPNAEPSLTDNGTLNYIRNSVKIVVDAYDGKVTYYIFDPRDPIIQAYSRIYPGMFRPKEEMSPELMPLVRYPQEIFDIQMAVYAKYHQTDPEVFYQQEDAWEFAATVKGKDIVTTKSYYLTLDLIEQGKMSFLLLAPMSPKGRSNLRALTLVGAESQNYGRMVVYNFPKGELVYGPSQVYALINQDTKVSEQFTLWDQIGSQVERGKMVILPIGKVVIYIQPVYLKSTTQLKIPELKRLIMTQGQVAVMEPTLEEAYAKLQGRLREEVQRMERRYGAPPAAAIPTPIAPQAVPPAPPAPRVTVPAPAPQVTAPAPPPQATPQAPPAPQSTPPPQVSTPAPQAPTRQEVAPGQPAPDKQPEQPREPRLPTEADREQSGSQPSQSSGATVAPPQSERNVTTPQ